MARYDREIEVLVEAVREAGALARAGFGGELRVEQKPDGQGPVSDVDRACDALLRQRLSAAFPEDALLTEESADDGAWRSAYRVWMVDPIDGTREYVAGVDEYAVMVGLCVDGRPVAGAVYAAQRDLLVYGAVGRGARLVAGGSESALAAPDSAGQRPRWIAVSRSHQTDREQRLCEALGGAERRLGSVGLKVIAVARGEVDCYLATSPKIKLWDTCAPDAVIAAAGGRLVDLFGRRLDYRERLAHPHGVVAASNARLETVIAVTRPLAAEFFPEAARRA
ncbi:MAG: 3'(2'),5'-bisphosphate nucleotidase CysQ [Deltaproteobacteria bacterium]|nr:3'(2'),5'-bisphosphate nucleotidase CysQ [Deltaproteobacteria bacterium]